MLGIILLNGISVANSIIIVDFIQKLVASGHHPSVAILTATRKRLRPILITSLTTILGMLPIALGLGEGGKILQPLGISVSSGLWVSMGFTLFLVPLLEKYYYAGKSNQIEKFHERNLNLKSKDIPPTTTILKNNELHHD